MSKFIFVLDPSGDENYPSILVVTSAVEVDIISRAFNFGYESYGQYHPPRSSPFEVFEVDGTDLVTRDWSSISYSELQELITFI